MFHERADYTTFIETLISFTVRENVMLSLKLHLRNASDTKVTVNTTCSCKLVLRIQQVYSSSKLVF